LDAGARDHALDGLPSLASLLTAISDNFLNGLLVCNIATMVCSANSSALLKLGDDFPLLSAGFRKDIQTDGICTGFEDSDRECYSESTTSASDDNSSVV
jgi:hypothetical protein